ncbi:domain of Kin17 curved DNA-binding protein-domain-containing protein [Mrakia frigida]|uniref:Rts2p n=1 Tax=Mrakia frigida TaxID=29902 RepID=UPI003FCBF444
MGKAAAGTPKAVANAMKSKGLGRLRWFCQVCEKQCRDDNGFKCHVATEAHLRQMLVVGESAGKYIDDFSKNFMDEFILLLSRRYNTKRIRANQVYQEYIQDKTHIHMNSTKWVTLTEFVKYLGKEGIVRVDETEKGFFISWVDNSPGALARQDAINKKERQDMDDEQRQRKLLADQIARATTSSSSSVDPSAPAGPSVEEGLVRDPEVKLSFSFGAPKPKLPSPPLASTDPSTSSTNAEASSSSSSAPSAPAPVKLGFSNPLKRAAPASNVFKSSKPSANAGASARPGGPVVKLSATQQLIKDDEERKKRMAENGGRGGFNGGGGGGGKRLKL